MVFAVYLEPGEAVALNAGYLTSSVMDIINNEIDIAILDTSAACHMPDVLEMPYRPNVIDAGNPGEYHTLTVWPVQPVWPVILSATTPLKNL